MRMEIEVRVKKLKNGKAAGKDKLKGEMIKGGGNRTGFGCCVIWLFEIGIVPEDWRSAVRLYKGNGERPECTNYRGINLLNVVGKINPVILVFD